MTTLSKIGLTGLALAGIFSTERPIPCENYAPRKSSLSRADQAKRKARNKQAKKQRKTNRRK